MCPCGLGTCEASQTLKQGTHRSRYKSRLCCRHIHFNLVVHKHRKPLWDSRGHRSRGWGQHRSRGGMAQDMGLGGRAEGRGHGPGGWGSTGPGCVDGATPPTNTRGHGGGPRQAPPQQHPFSSPSTRESAESKTWPHEPLPEERSCGTQARPRGGGSCAGWLGPPPPWGSQDRDPSESRPGETGTPAGPLPLTPEPDS